MAAPPSREEKDILGMIGSELAAGDQTWGSGPDRGNQAGDAAAKIPGVQVDRGMEGKLEREAVFEEELEGGSCGQNCEAGADAVVVESEGLYHPLKLKLWWLVALHWR